MENKQMIQKSIGTKSGTYKGKKSIKTTFIPPQYPALIITQNFNSKHISALVDAFKDNYIPYGMQTSTNQCYKMQNFKTNKLLVVVDDSEKKPVFLQGQFLKIFYQRIDYPNKNNIKKVIKKFDTYIGLGKYKQQVNEQLYQNQSNNQANIQNRTLQISSFDQLAKNQGKSIKSKQIRLKSISPLKNSNIRKRVLFVLKHQNQSKHYLSLVQKLANCRNKQIIIINKIQQYLRYRYDSSQGQNNLLLGMQAVKSSLGQYKNINKVFIYDQYSQDTIKVFKKLKKKYPKVTNKNIAFSQEQMIYVLDSLGLDPSEQRQYIQCQRLRKARINVGKQGGCCNNCCGSSTGRMNFCFGKSSKHKNKKSMDSGLKFQQVKVKAQNSDKQIKKISDKDLVKQSEDQEKCTLLKQEERSKSSLNQYQIPEQNRQQQMYLVKVHSKRSVPIDQRKVKNILIKSKVSRSFSIKSPDQQINSLIKKPRKVTIKNKKTGKSSSQNRQSSSSSQSQLQSSSNSDSTNNIKSNVNSKLQIPNTKIQQSNRKSAQKIRTISSPINQQTNMYSINTLQPTPTIQMHKQNDKQNQKISYKILKKSRMCSPQYASWSNVLQSHLINTDSRPRNRFITQSQPNHMYYINPPVNDKFVNSIENNVPFQTQHKLIDMNKYDKFVENGVVIYRPKFFNYTSQLKYYPQQTQKIRATSSNDFLPQNSKIKHKQKILDKFGKSNPVSQYFVDQITEKTQSKPFFNDNYRYRCQSETYKNSKVNHSCLKNNNKKPSSIKYAQKDFSILYLVHQSNPYIQKILNISDAIDTVQKFQYMDQLLLFLKKSNKVYDEKVIVLPLPDYWDCELKIRHSYPQSKIVKIKQPGKLVHKNIISVSSPQQIPKYLIELRKKTKLANSKLL